jgi:hypothetical protein
LAGDREPKVEEAKEPHAPPEPAKP